MRFNLGLIFAGICFFANPCFNLLDLLPDFIGAILIMTGLSKMYMYNINFEDAQKSAKFVLWLSVLKFALCVWTNSGNREYIMPFTFILGVLEVIFMISMFKSLYLGVDYTLMRTENASAKIIKDTNNAFSMSFVFIIALKILDFAPHLSDIAQQDAEFDLSRETTALLPVARLKGILYIACMFFALILGIIFLFISAKAWIKLIRNKSYNAYLKEKYDNYVLLDRDVFITSKINKVYFLVTVCFVFFISFYIDAVNIFPNFFGILMILGALCYLSKYAGIRKGLVLSAGLPALVCSVINYVYMHKVHLGINQLYAVETYNQEKFSLLSSRQSVFYSAVFSCAEFLLVTLLVFLCLDGMRKLFKQEKRTVALPMLTLAKILSVLALLSGAVQNILKTIEGHLATDSYVMNYVRNKPYITSEKVYNEFMANPLVKQYEGVSSAAYAAVFVTIALCIICLLYMTRVKRFTDGFEK